MELFSKNGPRCPYNVSGVQCEVNGRNCEQCGWNPKVIKKRRELIAKYGVDCFKRRRKW